MKKKNRPSIDSSFILRPSSFILVAAFAAILIALLALGQWTRDRVSNLDRYTTPFQEIECVPPPPEDQSEFLAEVQYIGAFPDRLAVLEEGQADKLAAAFAHHPRVKRVIKVSISPPHSIRVELVYATPSSP
jgi:hypothetical protein